MKSTHVRKKRAKCLALSAILPFLLSCSDEVIPKEEETIKEIQCYPLKYGFAMLDKEGNKIYPVEFEYEGNRIVKRLQYTLLIIAGSAPNDYQRMLTKTEEVRYNERGLPVKIIGPDHPELQVTEEIFYDTRNRMVRKEKIITTRYEIHTYDTYYTYDSQDRINAYTTNLHNSLTGETRVFTNTVSYDQDGNLSQTTRDVTVNQYAMRTVTTYSNYDNYKNALSHINVPFEEYMLMRYSKNNCRKMVSIGYGNGEPSGTGSEQNIPYHLYNEYGYPAIAEYRCE
ncbi:MAG: hypothetical protein LRY55_05195 [Leadbetterella sp.]|nr:hypothetical protein [Leadbetterella sp.]